MTPGVDAVLARLLHLPLAPLARWPHWRHWQRRCPAEAHQLALRLATGVRESLEEMRLNPFGIRFLGPLPPQRLVMFRRVIYPMAGWVPHQHRFFPNWEVEKSSGYRLKTSFPKKITAATDSPFPPVYPGTSRRGQRTFPASSIGRRKGPKFFGGRRIES